MANPVGYLYRVGQTAVRNETRPTGRRRSHPRSGITRRHSPIRDCTRRSRLTPDQRAAVMLVHAYLDTPRPPTSISISRCQVVEEPPPSRQSATAQDPGKPIMNPEPSDGYGTSAPRSTPLPTPSTPSRPGRQRALADLDNVIVHVDRPAPLLSCSLSLPQPWRSWPAVSFGIDRTSTTPGSPINRSGRRSSCYRNPPKPGRRTPPSLARHQRRGPQRPSQGPPGRPEPTRPTRRRSVRHVDAHQRLPASTSAIPAPAVRLVQERLGPKRRLLALNVDSYFGLARTRGTHVPADARSPSTARWDRRRSSSSWPTHRVDSDGNGVVDPDEISTG